LFGYIADQLNIPGSLAGLPALSVPCGVDQNNLPIGLQIIGAQWEDQKVFNAGYAFQKMTDWHTKRPGV
jgi:aspartyl-tRNA(Asn)/glutamyl-tRNA(Gln) amidotransferase subunit A